MWNETAFEQSSIWSAQSPLPASRVEHLPLDTGEPNVPCTGLHLGGRPCIPQATTSSLLAPLSTQRQAGRAEAELLPQRWVRGRSVLSSFLQWPKWLIHPLPSLLDSKEGCWVLLAASPPKPSTEPTPRRPLIQCREYGGLAGWKRLIQGQQDMHIHLQLAWSHCFRNAPAHPPLPDPTYCWPWATLPTTAWTPGWGCVLTWLVHTQILSNST